MCVFMMYELMCICIYVYDVYVNDLSVYLLLFRNGASTDWKLSFLSSDIKLSVRVERQK